MGLEQEREKINAIDKKMVKLFEERMHVSEKIAKAKYEKGQPIRDEKREAEVIQRVTSYLTDTHLTDELTTFYEDLMTISRDHQQKTLDHLAKGKGENLENGK